LAVGVHAATVLVADAFVAALVAGAAVQAGLAARVGGEMGRAGVGFPDIELVAADALSLDVTLEILLASFMEREMSEYSQHPQPRG
jgi:hypothetical protein